MILLKRLCQCAVPSCCVYAFTLPARRGLYRAYALSHHFLRRHELLPIQTEYSDDKAIVPRSTSVIARRLPPSRPGRGNAQYYMVSSDVPTTTSSYASSSSAAHGSGARRNHMSRRFDGKEDSPQKVSVSGPASRRCECAVFWHRFSFGKISLEWICSDVTVRCLPIPLLVLHSRTTETRSPDHRSPGRLDRCR